MIKTANVGNTPQSGIPFKVLGHLRSNSEFHIGSELGWLYRKLRYWRLHCKHV